MEKVTREYEVYNFEELDKDIQETLIEKEKEYQSEIYINDMLEQDMHIEADNILKEYFDSFELKNVYYDLSYSQGSGAIIEFNINIKDLNNKYNLLSSEELRFVQDKGIINDIEVYHNDNYYYHEYTFSIKYYDNFGYYDYEDIKEDYDITEENFNKLEDKIIDFLDTYNKLNKENSQFIEDIISINKELKKRGYDLIENEPDNDLIIDFLKDQRYLKNGDVF